jgi:lipopolysaccharide export system permease protein
LTILDRYIFRSVLAASAGAVAVFAFVLVVASVVRELLGAVASGQISLEATVPLVGLMLLSVISYALPMGILTGILLVLGRLSAQHEITAMRTAGWGLPRIGAPIIVVAVLGLGASLAFNAQIGPRAKTSYREGLADAVRTNPLSFIVPRTFVRTFPGLVIFASEKEGNRLRDLWMWTLDEQSRVLQMIRAQEGVIAFDEETTALILTAAHGTVESRQASVPEDFGRSNPRREITVPSFGTTKFSLPLEHLLGRNTFRRKLSLLTFGELRDELAKIRANSERQSAEEVFRRKVTVLYAIQEKFVSAFAVLSFALVGIPLGIKMQRRESSANLGLALVLSMTFYFMLIVVDWLQKQPHLRPDLLMWTPNLLFQTLGVWLFWRVDRQ